MSVELPPSPAINCQGFPPPEAHTTTDQEYGASKPARIAATLVLMGGMLCMQETTSSSVAHAYDSPVVIGMPFEGRWAYDSETTAGCGSGAAQTSHPSCHENYSGDWGTDLYGAAGTEVRLNVRGSAPLTFYWDTTASGTCGETRRVHVFSGGVSVGKIHITHLKDAATVKNPPTRGMVLGKIANLDCNPGGSGKHIHVELKNSSDGTRSCYTNHSNNSSTAGMVLAQSVSIGQLGSTNTAAAKQPCPSAPETPPSLPPLDATPAALQRGDETVIVAVAPDKTLDYYFNPGGRGVWTRLDIPGADAKSTPAAIVRSNGELNIAAQGEDGSLDFYYNPMGTNTWGKIEIAGPNSVYSAPSIIQRATGETNIAVQGANNTLDFYYNFRGNPSWYKITVPGSQAYSKPAIVQRLNGETNIAVLGQNNSMDFYWNTPGSPVWGKVPVAIGGTAMGAPSMIQRATGETIIAAQGQNHSLDLYLNKPGSPFFGRLQAVGENSTFNDSNPPAMLLRPDGELNIAVHGPGDTASIYYNAQGQQQWGQTMAAAPGYAFREPVMIQRATGETNLVVIGPNKRLDYYINNQGSGSWGVLPITHDGSTY